jgi:tetratricopeptide (TPR) repeat protein
MNKKLIRVVVVSGFALFLFIVGYHYVYENNYKIILSHRDDRIKRHELVEKSYKKKPNLSDAFDLMDYYIGNEDFDKALYYSKACLELGANDELLDGKINFFLARIYYAKNQKDLAKNYLLTAIELSKRDKPEKIELIKKYGLADIAPHDYRK